MSGNNDAHGKIPTVEEEMSNFKGFSTLDGETQQGEAAGKPSPREAKAAAANAKGSTIADAQKVAAEVEADEEAARAAAQAGTGEEGDEGEDETAGGTPENETDEEKAEREANETPEEKEAREAADAAKADKAIKHRSAERRIGQATAKQRAAERELAAEREARAKDRGEFEARMSALEARLTGGKSATTKDPLAPNAADYEYGELDGKYVAALARYEAKKELAAEREQETKAARTREAATAQSTLETKIAKLTEDGVKKFGAEFEEIVESGRNNEWPLPPIVGQLLIDSPQGAEIAKFLYENPKEGTRISQLAPAAQAAAFGRLEAKFSSGSSDATTRSNASAPVKTSKAPPVPASRARGAGGKTQVSEATTDFKAFEAAAMRRPN
jgi:hypothetical protein